MIAVPCHSATLTASDDRQYSTCEPLALPLHARAVLMAVEFETLLEKSVVDEPVALRAGHPLALAFWVTLRRLDLLDQETLSRIP